MCQRDRPPELARKSLVEHSYDSSLTASHRIPKCLLGAPGNGLASAHRLANPRAFCRRLSVDRDDHELGLSSLQRSAHGQRSHGEMARASGTPEQAVDTP